MAEGHLITAEQTLEHWPRELYLTDPVIDRSTRDPDDRNSGPDLLARASEQVERRLAEYQPIETDPAIDAAMRALILDGMESQDQLPELPDPSGSGDRKATSRRRGRRRRRGR